MEKIATVLPADVRHQVDHLNEIITIVQPPGRFDLDDPRLARLQEAILNHCIVIGYLAATTQRFPSVRSSRSNCPTSTASGTSARIAGCARTCGRFA